MTMNILKVDDTKCIHCGACIDVCPVKIIQFGESNLPEPVSWAKKACINCGHCVAVCPSAALSLETMPSSECMPIREDLAIKNEELEQFLRSRRSIRVYRPDNVDKRTIEKIIDTARYAPSGHNFQPVNWKVFYDASSVTELKTLTIDWMKHTLNEDPETAKKLHIRSVLMGCEQGLDIILRDAPHVVVAYSREDDRTAAASCRIAMTYFELAAFNLGIGACWAGYLDIALASWKPLQKALELPEGHISNCSMMIGYPKHKYRRIPLRNRPNISWK